MRQTNVAASIRARLLNLARERQQNFDLVLTRFCLERLLYRISISNHKDLFLLKGAMLFDLWFDIPHRPTRDVDFLGLGSSEISDIANTFREICGIAVTDGVMFEPDSVKTLEIRNEANYPGVRVTLLANVDGAHCHIQADIGFGDAVSPGPEEAKYPVILNDLEAPELLVYPHYAVVAEKFEALSTLGIANSRMKDYFDLWVMARRTAFDGETLKQSIRGTFRHRQSSLPREIPVGLTEAFSHDDQKQTQWNAFLTKNKLETTPLEEVVGFIADFLNPISQAARDDASLTLHWPKGGPWKSL